MIAFSGYTNFYRNQMNIFISTHLSSFSVFISVSFLVNTSSSSLSFWLVLDRATCFRCCFRSESIVIVNVVFSPVDLDCFLFPLFSLFVFNRVPAEVDFFFLSLPALSRALESETDDVLVFSVVSDSVRFLLPVLLRSSGLKNSIGATFRTFAIFV